MTMTPKPDVLQALMHRIMTAAPIRTRVQPSDADLERLFASVFDLAASLDVPRDRVPQLLITAHDQITATDYPYADHLVVLYAMTIFALYYVSDDTFDELLEHFAPER